MKIKNNWSAPASVLARCRGGSHHPAVSAAYQSLVGFIRETALPEVNEAPSGQLTSKWTPVHVSYLSGASSCIIARSVKVAAARPLESDQHPKYGWWSETERRDRGNTRKRKHRTDSTESLHVEDTLQSRMSDHTDGPEVAVAGKKRILRPGGPQGKHSQHEEGGANLKIGSGVDTVPTPHPSAAKKPRKAPVRVRISRRRVDAKTAVAAASASTSGCGASAKTVAVAASASTSGGGATAKTATAVASVNISGEGAGAKTAEAAVSASTSGKGVGAKTAVAAASASTSGRGASVKIVERSRATQQKRKSKRKVKR